VWHGALLGMTTAALAIGCGGAPSDPIENEHGSESAAITAIAPAVINGCTLSVAFDISAAKNIGFIAVDNLSKAVANSSSALNNMQLTLFQVDNQQRLHEVSKQATAIDSSLASLLSQVSKNESFARQASSAKQLTDTHFSQYTDVDRKLAATTSTLTGTPFVSTSNTAERARDCSTISRTFSAGASASMRNCTRICS